MKGEGGTKTRSSLSTRRIEKKGARAENKRGVKQPGKSPEEFHSFQETTTIQKAEGVKRKRR